MFAILAKPLDWCTIQLARRCVDAHAQPVRDPLPLPTTMGDLSAGAVVAPTDLVLRDDGQFTFRSLVQTAAPGNNIVHGRLFAAGKKWANFPTALLLHGWNAELCYLKMFPYLAGQLQRVGVNTVVVELPYHMHRRPRTGPIRDFISSDLGGMIEATRQAIADVRTICRWLEGNGCPTVGLWGFSLGAWLTGLITRWERNLGFAILTTPIARMDRAIAELPFCAPIRLSLEDQTVDLRPLNLASQRPCLPANRILLVQSRHDLFAPAETIDQLWEAWGRPERWALAHGHISVLASVPVMKRTVSWIGQRAAAAAA